MYKTGEMQFTQVVIYFPCGNRVMNVLRSFYLAAFPLEERLLDRFHVAIFIML